MASGTFSATGAGPSVIVNERADLSLAFAGTATVKLQRLVGSTWRDVPNAEWTASTEDIVYSGRMGRQYRLNCTVHTNDVAWELG